MRLTAFLLVASVLHVSAAAFSQKVTISGKNMTLEKIFTSIHAQTGYEFIYDQNIIDFAAPVSIQVKGASLTDALDSCLRGQSFKYRILDKTIVLVKSRPAMVNSVKDEELVPPLVVSGHVVDAKSGEPIVGASISLKGSPIGTSTDKNGAFTISIPREANLTITFIGYETKIIRVRDNTPLEIRMEVTDKSMNEVVINGIYSRPAQNFTGAATTFSAEQINKVSNKSLFSALSALDPSFQIPENISTGSNPNALPDVQIRGGNSITDPNAGVSTDVFGYTNKNVNVPLFILDGFEVSLQRVNDLDVNRIAKVSILKDASATSIYGSRAANGVVVIETLAPKNGKLRLTYNGSLNIEAPDLRDYDLLNAREKLDLELKGGIYKAYNNAAQESLNVLYNARLAEVERGVNTYWLSQPLRTGIGSKHNVFLEGGGGNALYGVGITYDKRAGVMKESDRENIMGNTYLSYRVKNLLFRNDLTLSFNTANNSPYGVYNTYATMNPYWTPYDVNGRMKYYVENLYQENGQIVNNDAQTSYGRFTNPLYNATLNTVDRNKYQNITDNISIQWQATDWLRLNTRFSLQMQKNQNDIFLPPRHTKFASLAAIDFDKKGSYFKADGVNNYYEGYITGDLNKTFGKHLFFATTGMNFSNTKTNTTVINATGFPNERLSELYNAIRYQVDSKPIGFENHTRLAGYLANMSYSYDSRYLLDLSYRLDGSSLFGSNKRFANFWSVGGGWNLHKERFISQIRAINRFKVRYSYGYTGSQKFESYLANTTSQYYSDRQYNNMIGTYLLGWGNPDLAWQQTRKHNLGADITLFDKLNITANYFMENTQGALATVTTAPSTGFTSYKANLGNLQNKGWELYANMVLYARKRDVVSIFVNAFSSKGKYTRISNSLEQLNKNADTSSSTKPLVRYAEGQSPTAIWAVQSNGIDPGNGREIFVDRNGKFTYTYSNLDQRIIGDSRSKVEGTFGTNVEIQGVGLNLYMRYRLGGQVYNQTLADRVENADIRYNVDRRVYEDRWLKPGDHTFFKGLVNPEGYSISDGPTLPTSRFVQNYSFLSCESFSMYYRFSDEFNKRLKVSNTKVTFYTGQLFRLANVKQERGLDYPFSQTFTFLIQTTF